MFGLFKKSGLKEPFYQFSVEDKQGCIRLEANVNYDGLSMLSANNPLTEAGATLSKVRGKNWYDFMQFNDSQFFVVSEKVKSLFMENGITGIEFFKIDVQHAPTNFYIPVITSVSGPILNLKALNNYETEHIEFDRKTLQGTNVFTLKDTLLFLCDEKVKGILKENKLTNLSLKQV